MPIKDSQHYSLYPIDGRTLTSGGSLNVKDGVLAVVSTKDVTSNGKKVLSSFSGLPKSKTFQILVGKKNVPVTRSTNNKPYESLPFSLEDIVDVQVVTPKQVGQKVDDFIIGYNGKPGTEIVIGERTSTEIELTLCGDPIYHLGYENGKVSVKLYLTAPYLNEDGTPKVAGEATTNQEIVENAVRVFNNMTLLGGAPITDYVEALVVNDLNTSLVSPISYTFYTLTVTDNGDNTAFARVQAQFPTFSVVKTERLNDTQSVYTILAPTGTTLTSYTTSLPQKLKGCEDCPVGYGELIGGVVYRVSIENGGVTATGTDLVDNLPGFVAGTSAKVAQNGSEGVYTVVVTTTLTDAQVAAFQSVPGAQATSVIELVGTIEELCENNTTVSTAWTTGTACSAVGEVYRIALSDNDCGNTRLAELQVAYPELTITVDGVSNMCQTTYRATVVSNVVCEECSEEFRALFTTKAPSNFGLYSWYAESKTFDEDAKMGIRFRGKEFILSGSEVYRDEMPFYYTSTRLALSGGQPNFVAESWNSNGAPFALKILSIASEPEALAAHQWENEDMSRQYFDGLPRFEGNNYGKWLWGQETKLAGTAQVVDYQITIDRKKHFQVMAHASERLTYHIITEVGRHESVETLLNSLAAAAGLNTVQAFAK